MNIINNIITSETMTSETMTSEIVASKTMTSENKAGYLALYVGPMYSGKTSKLLELYKQYDFCNIKTLVINFAGDTRYSNDMLSTHDKYMIPCMKANQLSQIANLEDSDIDIGSLPDYFVNSSVILINEGQFFKDIIQWVNIAIGPKYKKTVHICGLDSDFKRQKFGDWLDLITTCDKIEKLHSICSDCKCRSALFSYRLSQETEQTVIGSSNYIPLCRLCYENRINKCI